MGIIKTEVFGLKKYFKTKNFIIKGSVEKNLRLVKITYWELNFQTYPKS